MTLDGQTATRAIEWPESNRVYLTLDFECDYGTALRTNYYTAVQEAPQLVELLEAHDVPVSCFIQTEILENYPETVDPFRTADVPVDFHAHSHTHPDRATADVEYEVTESVRRIREAFDTDPIGFRFPDGAVKPQDYEVLAENDVDFSSSVFPSWRPGRFNNLDALTTPYEMSNTGIVELPFTVYSNYLRIPVSLSYLKLFGAAYERLVTMNPPDVIVLDLHMHDLITPPTFSELSFPYQVVYTRQKHAGLAVLDRVIQRLRNHGYVFGQMTDLHEAVSETYA